MCFEDNQQRYLGYIEASSGFGLIVGPLVGSLLYTYFGFKITFLICAFTFLIFGFSTMKVISDSVNKKDEDTFEQSADGMFERSNNKDMSDNTVR